MNQQCAKSTRACYSVSDQPSSHENEYSCDCITYGEDDVDESDLGHELWVCQYEQIGKSDLRVVSLNRSTSDRTPPHVSAASSPGMWLLGGSSNRT